MSSLESSIPPILEPGTNMVNWASAMTSYFVVTGIPSTKAAEQQRLAFIISRFGKEISYWYTAIHVPEFGAAEKSEDLLAALVQNFTPKLNLLPPAD